VVGPESAQKSKRKKRARLQISLGFVEETNSMPKRAIGKKERESQIRHLRQLIVKGRAAKRPDGEPMSSADDVILWLEEKIEVSEQSNPSTERLDDERSSVE
jgi:hypothetical protein